MYRQVNACRICGNKNLITVLELGKQTLTGVFPKRRKAPITSGPLTLVKCSGSDACGLLQLAHSYSLTEMYGENYGYRSGLNPSMVAHLRAKVDRIKSFGVLRPGDVVIDIGSNDGTTLKQYEMPWCRLVGIDPTGSKFRQYYADNLELIPDFFSADAFVEKFGDLRAKVVTSFSMFYDLEDPVAFMRQIKRVLHPDGIWVFEQSYMPSMLTTNSYDTVCHEHLEYYALSQILWMAEKVGFEVVDVELNDVNGGSFSVTAQHRGARLKIAETVANTIDSERTQRLEDLQTYRDFAARVETSRRDLLAFLNDAKARGKTVAALGASTKGNVVLQYCGVDESLIFAVGEINPDKFGSYTPGSDIPIANEADVLRSKPDYVLVLPWHFRRFFETQPRYAGQKLVYPLPVLSLP